MEVISTSLQHTQVESGTGVRAVRLYKGSQGPRCPLSCGSTIPRIITSASWSSVGHRLTCVLPCGRGKSSLGDYIAQQMFTSFWSIAARGINFPALVPNLGLNRHREFLSDPLGASDLSCEQNLPKVTAVSGAWAWE